MKFKNANLVFLMINLIAPLVTYIIIIQVNPALPVGFMSFISRSSPKIWLEMDFILRHYSSLEAERHFRMYVLIIISNIAWQIVCAIVRTCFSRHIYYSNDDFKSMLAINRNHIAVTFGFVLIFFASAFIVPAPLAQADFDMSRRINLGFEDFMWNWLAVAILFF